MEIPGVGYWVAYFFTIFSFLAVYTLPAAVGQMVSGRMSEVSGPISIVRIVRIDGSVASEWEYLWRLFGWTGLVWLLTVAVLGVWIAIKMRAGGEARGLTNLLILVVGWPTCFLLATHVLVATTSR